MSQPAVTLILGAERFLARAALEDQVAAQGDREVSRFDGDSACLAEILDDVRTPTLFGGARTVVVSDAGKLLDAPAIEALAAFAEKPPPNARLIVQAASLDRRLKIVKRLEAASHSILCKPLAPREIANWIGQRAQRAHGMRADGQAIRELHQRIGDDLGALDGALRRLKEQIAPRAQLRADDVASSTEAHRSPLLFEASNALEQRHLRGALDAVAGAFHEGVRIHQDLIVDEAALGPILLSNLHRAYVKLLRFHLARKGGMADADAARTAGVSPRAASYFAQRASGWRLDALVGGHGRFVQADRDLKRSSSPRRVLERLLLDVLR